MRAVQFLIVAAIFAIVSPSFTSPSFATTIVAIEGVPQVNSGNGFRPVASETAVAPGDKVMVSPGGSAEIVYNEKCKIYVAPGQVAVVAAASPCVYLKAPVKAEPQYDLGPVGVVGLGVLIGIVVANQPSPGSP
jgi:hypothetical protein